MAIEIEDIEVGYIYNAKDNQHRLVLGFTDDCKVVYADRGSEKMNAFKSSSTTSSVDTFAEACNEKLKKVNNLDELIKANNAEQIVTPKITTYNECSK